MIDTVKSAFLSLLRKPMRSILTILAVGIGASSVIIINIISNCGMEAINTEMDSLGMGGLLIAPVNETSPDISQDDVEQVRTVNSVEKAAPVVLVNGEIVRKGENFDAYVWGIDSTAKDVISLNLMYGRYINKADVTSSSTVCMVDNSFARTVYGRDNIVGKKLSVTYGGLTDELEVVGVIKTGSGLLQNLMGTYIPNFIYVPCTNVQQSLNTDGFHRIIVKTADGADAQAISDRIVNRLEMNTGAKGAFNSTNLVKQKESLSNIMNIVSLILGCVGAVALVVASMGIMTIMLVSVNERTKEIGIKKSIGAGNKNIVFEFLCEAVMLSIMGCVLGLVISLVAVLIGDSVLDFNAELNLVSILPVLGLSVAVGAIFGVYPAYRAASLNPVDALRR